MEVAIPFTGESLDLENPGEAAMTVAALGGGFVVLMATADVADTAWSTAREALGIDGSADLPVV